MNAVAETKDCSRCKRELPIAKFHRRGPNGRQAWCGECKTEANRLGPPPPRFVPCAICGTVHERFVHRVDKHFFCGARCRSRASLLRFKYGLEPEDWRALWDGQHGLCAMPGCQVVLGMFGAGGHHVDHDHDTGVVRSLLCHACNVGLGWYERMAAIGADFYLSKGR